MSQPQQVIVHDLIFDMSWFVQLSMAQAGMTSHSRLGELDPLAAERRALHTLREQAGLLKVAAFVAERAEITVTPASYFDPTGTEEWSSNSEWRHYLRPQPFLGVLGGELLGRVERLWKDVHALIGIDRIRFAAQRYEDLLQSPNIDALPIPEIEKRILRMAREVQEVRGIANVRLALDTDMWDWQVNVSPEGKANPEQLGAGAEKVRSAAREMFGQHLHGTMIPLGSPTLLDGLAGFRIGGAARSPALLDTVAEATYMSEKNRILLELFEERSGARWPRLSVAQVAQRIAATYVTTTVPALIASPAEVVLSWRDLLGDSLEAFQTEVELITMDAHGLDEDDLSAFVAHVTPQLDLQYREIRRQADSSRLRVQVEQHLPEWVGAAGGTLFLAAVGQPLTVSVVGAGVAKLLTSGLRNVIARSRVERHPLYWRLALGEAAEQ